jgi:hypothetical protein
MGIERAMGAFKSLIEALNSIGMQVWAIVILIIGAGLVMAHQADHGSMIVGGGLALLQHPRAAPPPEPGTVTVTPSLEPEKVIEKTSAA